MFNTNFAPKDFMLEATNKVLYLCLVLFLAHSTCSNYRVKYIAKFVIDCIIYI